MATALTTLVNVKAWCAVSSSGDDTLLTRLIAQASRAIYAYLTTNTLFLQTFSQAYDGVNNSRLILKEWPVISVASVYINGSNVNACPAQPQSGAGYRFESFNGVPPGQPQALDLIGGGLFYKGQQNVYVTYDSGYSVSDEAHTVPASTAYTITVDQVYGAFGQDDGVVSVAGVVYTKVTGAPAAGQYSVSTAGVYTFNATNASTPLLISYSYIPFDIEQACIEMVSERYFYKQRVGQKTKSLGGQETASYDLSAMSEYVKILLQPYKRTNIV